MADQVPVTPDPLRAAAAVRAGGLAAIPTETVYGLAARADEAAAVARIYAVKGRPADHPLIVHLPDAERALRWAASVPDYASRLAEAFWPGPMTLILPRATGVGDFVTAGQPTVGLRVPDHPLTLAMLHALAVGVAAPSANRFGRVSPTSAAHVVAELDDRLDPSRDIILDGGPSRVGVESSIIACLGERPVLLRPGAVSAAEVSEVTGLPVGEPAEHPEVRAPGTLASHYAPRARVILDQVPDLPPGAAPIGLLAPSNVATPAGVVRLLAPASDAEYAAGLYGALREGDYLLLERIHVIPPTGAGGLAAAIRDRVRRAATDSIAQQSR